MVSCCFEFILNYDKLVFTAFTKVIMNTSMISTVSNAEDIVSAMLKMDLGKREKGSKNGECKFKSLLQRWYGGKIKTEDSNKKESEELTRGSIVQIFESTSKMFVVTTVSDQTAKIEASVDQQELRSSLLLAGLVYCRLRGISTHSLQRAEY